MTSTGLAERIRDVIDTLEFAIEPGVDTAGWVDVALYQLSAAQESVEETR